ncbi:hypothetical protein AMECASPLE_011906 [Ameca splendens]|uniref:Uncharacterized protein n=1 Tax=Ameca splendens TaxID=208324 RepID=A0ABV0YZM4_9TELE
MKEDKDTGCGAETVGGSDGERNKAEAGPAARSGSVGPNGPRNSVSVRLPESIPAPPLQTLSPPPNYHLFSNSYWTFALLKIFFTLKKPKQQTAFFVKLEMHGLIFPPVVLLI